MKLFNKINHNKSKKEKVNCDILDFYIIKCFPKSLYLKMYECVTCNCMIACVCDLLGGMQYKVGDKLLNSIKIKNKIFSLYPLTFITKYGSSGVLNA